jgi:hypothetical protein
MWSSKTTVAENSPIRSNKLRSAPLRLGLNKHATDGDADVARLYMTVTNGQGVAVCDVWSPPLAVLTDGSWHNIAFVMRTNPRSRPSGLASVHFYVDGAHGYAECKYRPSTERTDDAAADSIMWANPLRWNANFVGGARDGNASRTSAIIGGRYEPSTGTFSNLLDGTLDDVAFHDRILLPNEVKLLATSIPCARGYTENGYAFFPDTPAIHGEARCEIRTEPVFKSAL